MAHKSYREESKKDWGTGNQDALSLEQIQLGALLRIADATEAMAKNYIRMQDDLEYYKKHYREQKIEIAHLSRSNRALKGHFRRLKKQNKL
jgi:hypothetical protein